MIYWTEDEPDATWGTDRNWEYLEHEYPQSRYRYYSYQKPEYKYKFKTLEELVSSDVFQQSLAKSLAYKDSLIRNLQEQIMCGCD